MRELTIKEKAVLQWAILQPSLSLAEMSKRLKIKAHIIRRILENLQEMKVLLSVCPYLNLSKLGISEYLVFLSLTHCTAARRQEIVAFLAQHNRVGSLSEVGGDYQFEIRYFSRSNRDLVSFMDDLSQLNDVAIDIPAIAGICEEEYSGVHYVRDKKFTPPPLRYGPCEGTFQIDESDHRILSALCSGKSQAEACRATGLPSSTIAYRQKNLEQKGVITGYYWVCDVKPLGGLPFSLLIESHPMGAKMRQEFVAFCNAHPQIAYVNTLIGSWQARVFARVGQYQDLVVIMHELYERFPQIIRSIRIMPQLRFLKDTFYPFKSIKEVLP